MPASITGPYCADRAGFPRYCSTIWIDVLKGHLAPSTRSMYASAADSLYQHAESMVPSIDLDAALLAPDLLKVEAVLSASLLARQADQDARRWRLACSFVFSILQNIVGSDTGDMTQRLRFMRQRFAQLSVRVRRPSSNARALPPLALEDIYEVLHPTSLRNPFRTSQAKWRNFVLFLVLLQLGLRKGEALSLSVDALKQQFEPEVGAVRLWLDVSSADEGLDERARKPRLKTNTSQRQLPVSGALAAAIDTYVSQYRGDVEHGFLFSSAEGRPLAPSSVDHLIRAVQSHMSPGALAALEQEGTANLSAHSLHSKLPSPDPEQEMAAARSGQLLYAAAGVTTAQEGATTLPMLQQLQRVASQDGLIIDVIAYPFITDLDAILKVNPVATFGRYDHRLKIGGCKVTVDGSPQGKTAWFTTPYLTGGPGGEANWRGEPSLPTDAIRSMVKTCYDNDLQVLMHGNGDAAIDFLIATHKEMAGADLVKDRRTVCIHCQFIRPDQIAEFAILKIIPSRFTDHTFFFGDTHVMNRGLTQAAFISPMKAAFEAGLRPTNHTDAFVVPIDQMMTVWTAVNRPLRSGGVLGADQRITPYQALQAITINAAYQYREDATKGSVAAGKRADFVILSADPTKVAPETIREIHVIETIKDGRTIYNRP